MSVSDAVFLDHAAGTHPCREALDAFQAALLQQGNPSATHRHGALAAQTLRLAREQVAEALDTTPDRLIFTSGGSESNNLALYSAVKTRRPGQPVHIVTTALEHASVREPLRHFRDATVTVVPPDKSGRVSVERLADAVTENTALVSAALLCGDNGAVLPLSEMARAVKAKHPDVLFHTDAVQAFLKIPVTPGQLGVDYVSVSAHKTGGLPGAGALWYAENAPVHPLIFGGGQESGLRAGTEPVPLLSAFGMACAVGRRDLTSRVERLWSLKRDAVRRLSALPGFVEIPPGDAPHILSFALSGYPGEVLVRFLSDRGVSVSTGSACARGKASEALRAMSLLPEIRTGALRVSLSPDTTEADLDRLAEVLCLATEQLVRGSTGR